MGWPRKNEECKLYYESGTKTYLLCFIEHETSVFNLEAVGESLIDNDPEKPNLCETQVSPMHIYQKCKRVQWDEMPQIWQEKLGEYINGDPKDCRGLWRIKE